MIKEEGGFTMKVSRLSLLGILSLSMLLTGCGGSSTTTSSLSQVSLMEKDFYDQWVVTGKMNDEIGGYSGHSLSQIGIKVIYGVFRGAYVLSYLVNGTGGKGAWNTPFTMELGANYYSFNVRWTPHVWSEGKVVSLSEAYEAKTITEADLAEIKQVAETPVERNFA